MIEVLLNNEVRCSVSDETLVDTVRGVLLDHGVRRGEVSLAIIDDATMRRLNQTHLQHDHPTDVLSFLFHRDGDLLEGEVIVSAETAARAAGEYGWTENDELMLYAIHGTLHLVGCDDRTAADRQAMRTREAHYLRRAGIELPSHPPTPTTRGRGGPKPTSRETPA